MRRVRASSGRRVAAAAVDVTAVADTAAAGVMVVVVASEEAAATSQLALPSDRCWRIRCLSGFALADDLILCAEDSARYSSIGQMWAGLDSNQRRHKPADLQSAPFGHFGTYPF